MDDAAAVAAQPIVQKFNKALHDRGAFCCGVEAMDRFFKDSLTGQVKADYLQAYVLVPGDPSAEGEKVPVMGFFTLSAMTVENEHYPKYKKGPKAPQIPVLYVKAVAIDQNCQGKGYGTAMMIAALRKAEEISRAIGSAAVVLDVYQDEDFQKRWDFYTELGFRELNDPKNTHRVYLPMADIRKTLG